jgi:CheY-like chemotaxis protein
MMINSLRARSRETLWHRRGDDTGNPAVQKRRVLVVDDNNDLRDYLGMMLETSGHDVQLAGDGVEAVELARTFRPDIVLLDIQMPRLDGCEACRRIRAEEWGKDIAIYAVTGLDLPDDIERARGCGFTAHLFKPVDPIALMQLV